MGAHTNKLILGTLLAAGLLRAKGTQPSHVGHTLGAARRTYDAVGQSAEDIAKMATLEKLQEQAEQIRGNPYVGKLQQNLTGMCPARVNMLQVVASGDQIASHMGWGFVKKVSELLLDGFAWGQDQCNLALCNVGETGQMIQEFGTPECTDRAGSIERIRRMIPIGGTPVLATGVGEAAELMLQQSRADVINVMVIHTDGQMDVSTSWADTLTKLSDIPVFVPIVMLYGSGEAAKNQTVLDNLMSVAECHSFDFCPNFLKMRYSAASATSGAMAAKKYICSAAETIGSVLDPGEYPAFAPPVGDVRQWLPKLPYWQAQR